MMQADVHFSCYPNLPSPLIMHPASPVTCKNQSNPDTNKYPAHNCSRPQEPVDEDSNISYDLNLKHAVFSTTLTRPERGMTDIYNPTLQLSAC